MAERPEDLNLPTPVVSKLINDCLPNSCKVTDEAKVAITKVRINQMLRHHRLYLINLLLLQAASVFVLYATSQANTVAQNQSRKTISGPDVISAMAEMEFDKFVRPLENSLASGYSYCFGHTHVIFHLAVWKKGQQDKKELATKKKAAKKGEASESGDKDKNPEVIEIE